MNRGIYCAVGVATGVFMLGGGVAQAGAAAHDDITQAQSPADRTELLDGLGGAKLGGVDLLGTLLNGITTGGLLGGLTGEGGGPLGALLGGGPLGGLTGGTDQAPAGTDGAAAATVNSPTARAQASSQARPAGVRPVAATGIDAADSATDTTVANLANPTRWLATGTAAVRDNAVGDEPVSSTSSNQNGLEEAANPLGGDMLLGPDGPLGQIEILGGDTLAGLPVAGDLLAGGISLGTIDNIPAITDVVDQIRGQEADKTLPALGNLPTIGDLSRMLLGSDETDGPAEAAGRVTEHRILTQHTIDKTKVTPQLQELSGIVHQLPLGG